MISLQRTTKETKIELELDMGAALPPQIRTPLPFFDHLLSSMAFHGRFYLGLKADGDVEVDPHHLVEDVGLVLGMALHQYQQGLNGFERFGHAVVPMDESLSEVSIDVCGRPVCVYTANYPQMRAGQFDLWLIREFLLALSQKAQIALHARCRYGENAHHMVESLFKALGRAMAAAYRNTGGEVPSTKGLL